MFKKILERIITDLPGGCGGILMGYDGIAVEQFIDESSDIDLQLVAIEYSNVVKEIRQTAEILGTGALQEVTIKTENLYVIIRALTEEYFVAVILRTDGNLGKGRYLIKRETSDLRQALS